MWLHNHPIVTGNVSFFKIQLGRVLRYLKLNLLVHKNKGEFGWRMENPHHWKCKSISYGWFSKFSCFWKIWPSYHASVMIKFYRVEKRPPYEVVKIFAQYGLEMREKQMIKNAHPMGIYTQSKKSNILWQCLSTLMFPNASHIPLFIECLYMECIIVDYWFEYKEGPWNTLLQLNLFNLIIIWNI